ncbi:MAG: hypothetical protein IH965_11665 [Gemmatimonadetes bacterium]|nr:hypothetical protein [Gemmatimonadota bacterium]
MDEPSSKPATRQHALEEAHAPRRGGWIAVAVVAAALIGAAALAYLKVRTGGFDLDDADIFRPVRTLWREAAGILLALTVGSLILAGRMWARWTMVILLVAGSGWLFLFADIAAEYRTLATITAALWGFSAWALAVPRSVASFVHNQQLQHYRSLLGPLRTADDADRWLSVLQTWREAQLLGRSERRQVARAVLSWIDQEEGSLEQDVVEHLRARARIR